MTERGLWLLVALCLSLGACWAVLEPVIPSAEDCAAINEPPDCWRQVVP